MPYYILNFTSLSNQLICVWWREKKNPGSRQNFERWFVVLQHVSSLLGHGADGRFSG